MDKHKETRKSTLSSVLFCWVGIKKRGNQSGRLPYGFRKCPGGTFSRKAVADLFGQVMNGGRKVSRSAERDFLFVLN